LILYLIGIPLATSLCLLFLRRKYSTTGTKNAFLDVLYSTVSDIIARFGIIYITYRPEAFYYELVNLMRRVLLIVVASLPQTPQILRSQLVSATIVAVTVIHCLMDPFFNRIDNILETMSLVTLSILSIFKIGSADDLCPVTTDICVSQQDVLVIIAAYVPAILIPFFLRSKYREVRGKGASKPRLVRHSRPASSVLAPINVMDIPGSPSGSRKSMNLSNMTSSVDLFPPAATPPLSDTNEPSPTLPPRPKSSMPAATRQGSSASPLSPERPKSTIRTDF